MELLDETLSVSKLLVNCFDPILRTSTQPYNFENPQFDLDNVERVITRIVHEYGTLGLTCPQLGLPYSAAIFPNILGQMQWYINPKITYYDNIKTTFREGSVNFIGIAAKVKRSDTCRARYATRTGGIVTELFEGSRSNGFQQVCDQLGGVLFYERASFFERQRAFRQIKQLAREEKKRSNG